MTRLLIIGLGGFLGAIARYGLSSAIGARTTSAIPWGTLGVNVLGCFLLGALMGYSRERPVDSELQFFLRVGILGAFTTFSTLGYETVELFSTGRLREGLVSLFGNLLLGGLAVVAGEWLARWQFS
ncbi:MAG: fluoride efflux transporter CrcB [bacterium]|jgi:CrcB protein|nr:fluoride efflux transporter CrcB [Planctomycetota bacterium]HIL51398.1 fluoride efflux transporter CrcB [Planctomycetota bacterium]